MNYVNLAVRDSAETLLTATAGGLGSKLLFETRYLNFGETFLLNYLNGLDAVWLYVAIFGGANALSNVTGDFIAPLITKNDVFQQVNKITKPITVGVLAVLITLLINGFDVSMIGMAQAFSLGAASNIVGQWGSSFVPSIGGSRNSVVNSSFQSSSVPMPIAKTDYSPAVIPFDGFGAPFDLFGGGFGF